MDRILKNYIQSRELYVSSAFGKYAEIKENDAIDNYIAHHNKLRKVSLSKQLEKDIVDAVSTEIRNHLKK